VIPKPSKGNEPGQSREANRVVNRISRRSGDPKARQKMTPHGVQTQLDGKELTRDPKASRRRRRQRRRKSPPRKDRRQPKRPDDKTGEGGGIRNGSAATQQQSGATRREDRARSRPEPGVQDRSGNMTLNDIDKEKLKKLFKEPA